MKWEVVRHRRNRLLFPKVCIVDALRFAGITGVVALVALFCALMPGRTLRARLSKAVFRNMIPKVQGGDLRLNASAATEERYTEEWNLLYNVSFLEAGKRRQ